MNMKKTLITTLLMLAFTISAGHFYKVQAQGSTPPQPPGYHNNSNNSPPGGGAPVGEGIWLLLACGLYYGSKKI